MAGFLACRLLYNSIISIIYKHCTVIFERGIPMKKKLIRIMGIVGGALTMLPYLLFVGQCLYTLALPDGEVHFESKGYAGGFLVIFALPAVASIAGFIGSLLVNKRRKPGAILMIISGAIIFMFGIPLLFFGYTIPYDIKVWVEKIPPLMLIAAGAILLGSSPDADNPNTKLPETPAEPSP